jgi:hypothetical protein
VRLIENEIDLRHFEAGQLDLDVEVDQALQFDGQDLAIPPCLLRELVVSKDVRAFVGFT